MTAPQLSALGHYAALLRCPLCHGGFSFQQRSLVCPKKHTYDIAAKGYAHLAPDKKQPKGYDNASFQARAAFLDAGYYDHILQAALDHLPPGPWVDAGCGEGWFAARGTEASTGPAFGVDLSKDAVRRAAGRSKAVAWLVADLANLPLKNGSMQAVVNLFSPANYREFVRVLTPGGVLIKVVPGSLHLQELRGLAAHMLPAQGPEPGQVADLFGTHLQVVETSVLTRTLPLPAPHAQWLLKMTPMLFGKDVSSLSAEALTHITVDARLLVGRTPTTRDAISTDK